MVDRKGRALGFVMTIFQKIAASSFAAVRRTLRRRILMLTLHEAILKDQELDIDGREQLFAAWRTFFERLADQGTVALVFEDLHWADDGLLDFVEHLARWAEGPILISALARPDLLERRPGWGGAAPSRLALALDPLPEPNAVDLDLAELLLPRWQGWLERFLERWSEQGQALQRAFCAAAGQWRALGCDKTTPALLLGAIGSLAGAALGGGVQRALPPLVTGLFGADLTFWNDPSPLGIVISIVICAVAARKVRVRALISSLKCEPEVRRATMRLGLNL